MELKTDNKVQWQVIDFGKFKDKGRTLPQILFIDPDWFFYQYMLRDSFLKKRHKHDAEKLYYRAKNIKPPMGKYIKYFIHNDGSSWSFSLIDKVEAKEKFSAWIGREIAFQDKECLEATPFTILDRVDMSFPYKQKSYDKLGNKLFIQSLKDCILQTKVLRKEKIEAFFSDEENFF